MQLPNKSLQKPPMLMAKARASTVHQCKGLSPGNFALPKPESEAPSPLRETRTNSRQVVQKRHRFILLFCKDCKGFDDTGTARIKRAHIILIHIDISLDTFRPWNPFLSISLDGYGSDTSFGAILGTSFLYYASFMCT